MVSVSEDGPVSAEHPTNGIDETVHQRHRLGILTITAEAKRAEFGYLREAHEEKDSDERCRWERRGIPPFAQNAKDGAPGVLLL